MEEKATAGVVEYAHLLGTPPMREFLEFIRARRIPVDTQSSADAELVEKWHGAADYLRQLERGERDGAKSAVLLPLSTELESLAKRELEDPCTRAALEPLPYRWALVSLDELVVHQRSVDLTYIESLRKVLPAHPTAEELFLFAAGRLSPRPPVRVTRTSENVYTFSSPSADLRFLDFALLDPQAVSGYEPPGRSVGGVAAFVGYGVNFLCALRVQEQLILINGTNRLHLAYSRGILRVPCLVREAAYQDDFDVIGDGDLKQNAQLYLRARRPPRIRDFFDPQLHTIIRAAVASRLVHIQLNTQRSRVSIGY